MFRIRPPEWHVEPLSKCNLAFLRLALLFMCLASSSIRFSFWHDEIRLVFRFRICESTYYFIKTWRFSWAFTDDVSCIGCFAMRFTCLSPLLPIVLCLRRGRIHRVPLNGERFGGKESQEKQGRDRQGEDCYVEPLPQPFGTVLMSCLS